jgi:hypothetical protein
MDDKFKEILAGLPEKRHRSRLAPYCDLIDELRRRRLTYRDIAQILAEKCQLNVASSPIVRFMRTRSMAKGNRPKCQAATLVNSPEANSVTRSSEEASCAAKETPAVDVVYQRVASIKQRPALIPETAKLFHYDPNEPLQLPPRIAPRKTNE